MNTLNNKTALVTGGSRGIGREIVMALAAEGTKVWTVARNPENLEALKREVKGVQTIVGDVTHPETATESLRDIAPDILVLNAGATSVIAPLSELSWDEFNIAWETDVKATFYFGKQALLTPLKPGSTVIIISSGSALSGGALAGSYAGAKRTQWFIAKSLQQESNSLKLGIRFVVLMPMQVIGSTKLGDNAATRFATMQGISKQQFLEGMGMPLLTTEAVGKSVISLLK